MNKAPKLNSHFFLRVGKLVPPEGLFSANFSPSEEKGGHSTKAEQNLCPLTVSQYKSFKILPLHQ